MARRTFCEICGATNSNGDYCHLCSASLCAKTRKTIRALRDFLDQLAVSIRELSTLPTLEEFSDPVKINRMFFEALVCKIIYVDYEISLSEVDLYNRLFDEEATPDWFTAFLKEWNTDVVTEHLPTILFSLMKADTSEGTHRSESMINRIEEFCIDVASIDGRPNNEEKAEISKLMSFYRQQLTTLSGTADHRKAEKANSKIESQPQAVSKSARPEKAPEAPKPGDDLEAALLELKALIGLSAVKQEVVSLTNVMKVHRLRAEKGYPSPQYPCILCLPGILGPVKRQLLDYLDGFIERWAS
jgi:hypothetical protein